MTGGRCLRITSPANSPYAIAVGAIDTHGTPRSDSDDTVATYSSRGRRVTTSSSNPTFRAWQPHRGGRGADSYLSRMHPSGSDGETGRTLISSCRDESGAAVTSGAVRCSGGALEPSTRRI